jgi:hypothetical protein
MLPCRIEYNPSRVVAINGNRNWRASEFGFLFMSTGIMENRLLRVLEADSELQSAGCTATSAPNGGISVQRQGTELGNWRWQHGAFQFRVTGTTTPSIEVDTIAEAARYTRDHVCRPV